MSKKRLHIHLFFSLWLVTGLACSLFTPGISTPARGQTDTPSMTVTPTETAAPPPTATATPPNTSTPEPLSQRVTLTSIHFEESGQAPKYTLTAETPNLTGADDPRVTGFNQAADEIVQENLNEFKASLKYQPAVPITSGSFIDVGYEVVSPHGDILSIIFRTVGYGDGAAHPYHYAQTLTYDLESGTQISLDQIFMPGTDYLQAISDYCKTELAGRDIAFDAFSTGADPTAENYRNWNLIPAGLMITFDEYQVAAYAAGAQTVVIPYSTLRDILAPEGPVSKISG